MNFESELENIFIFKKFVIKWLDIFLSLSIKTHFHIMPLFKIMKTIVEALKMIMVN